MTAGRAFRRVAALAAALLLVTVPIARGHDQGITYGARPARHGDAVRPSGHFAHALEPGMTVVDAVQIFNFSYVPIAVLVYAADMLTTPDGRADPAPRSAEPNGTGAWLAPVTASIEVAPRGSVRVPFSITVPLDAEPGRHTAAILVEHDADSGAGSIRSRTRISLRVDIEVLGEIDLGVSLSGLEWQRDGAGIRFTLIATNTGTVTFTAGGALTVSRLGGDPIAVLPWTPIDQSAGPGDEVGLEARWRDPPTFGHFEAQPLVTATVSGRIPREFTGAPVRFWLVPWGLLVGGALALGLLSGLLFASRRRLREWAGRRREERVVIAGLRARRRSHAPTGPHGERYTKKD